MIHPTEVGWWKNVTPPAPDDTDGPLNLSCGSALALSIALIPLFPGLLFGGLFLFFTPLNILEGRGSWLAAYPITNALVQITSLVAWLRPSRRLVSVPFTVWSALTVLCSVVLIAELQRQINVFDGDCGNALLGPMFMQVSACGTILGMLVLAFASIAIRYRLQ